MFPSMVYTTLQEHVVHFTLQSVLVIPGSTHCLLCQGPRQSIPRIHTQLCDLPPVLNRPYLRELKRCHHLTVSQHKVLHRV